MHIDMARMHVCKEICTCCICVELSVHRHSVYCIYMYIYIYRVEGTFMYRMTVLEISIYHSRIMIYDGR